MIIAIKSFDILIGIYHSNKTLSDLSSYLAVLLSDLALGRFYKYIITLQLLIVAGA